jgi:hypothetical protein
VKVEHCDIDDDGHLDSIVRAWRHPALKKQQVCSSTPSGPAQPQSGPTGLDADVLVPQSGPAGLGVDVLVPQSGPTGLGVDVLVPQSGPSNLTGAENIPLPATGPSNITATVAVPAGTNLTILPKTGNINLNSTNHNGSLYTSSGSGTVNLGGIYNIDNPSSSGLKTYTRTHKYNIDTQQFVADTDHSSNRSRIYTINNYHTGWNDQYILNHGTDADTYFTFGGVLNASLIHPTGNGSTEPSFLLRRTYGSSGMDLSLLEGSSFVPFYNGSGGQKTVWYHITSV